MSVSLLGGFWIRDDGGLYCGDVGGDGERWVD